MFELNKIFIRKAGWSEYQHGFWKQTISFKNAFLNGSNQSLRVMYYIKPSKSEKTFIIAEFLDKQNSFVEYKFVIADGNKPEIDLLNSKQISIKSNIELMSLIKDYEACNEEYQRHFKLNKILK